MVKKSALLALLLAVTVAGSVSPASATGRAASHPTRSSASVSDLNSRSEGPMARLVLVSNRLIMSLRSAHGLVWVDLGSLTTDDGYGLDMTEGPDGVDPLGAKDQGLRQSGPTPVTQNSRR